jgi:hypothetical protein
MQHVSILTSIMSLVYLCVLSTPVHAQSLGFDEFRKLLASDGAESDQYGMSVSISGDYAVVGAYRDDDNGTNSGSVYVFSRNEGGTDAWGSVAKLTASDGAKDDYFGISVSIYGEDIIVGANSNNDSGSNSGSAYVFSRNQGGDNMWGEVVKLTASDGTGYDQFGYSVSISGDDAVVGMFGDSTNIGAAYVFSRNQSGADAWGEVAKLTASDGAAEDKFGWSVSISGDYAAVGAKGNDDGASNTGSAYVFSRNQDGTDAWGQVKKLNATGGAWNDEFGYSVSISGDNLVVGVYKDDDNGSDSGSAYVFSRNQGGDNTWGKVTKLLSSDGAWSDKFGYSVSISGDSILVGAYQDDSMGSAYLFSRNVGGTDTWGEVTKLSAADGAGADWFGGSVSISGEYAVIGAHLDDDLGSASGSAYLFHPNFEPVWSDRVDTTIAEGDLLTFTVAASDSESIVLTYGAPVLPVGAAFNDKTQTFTWTPGYDQQGDRVAVFSVSDGGATVLDTIGIAVTNVNDPPAWNAQVDTSVTENELLEFIVSATDPDDDALTYDIAVLPVGALFDSETQTLTWTPDYNQAGDTITVFSVWDNLTMVFDTVAIAVTNANRSPMWTVRADTITTEGDLLEINVAAIDPDADSLTYSAPVLPVGALFDAVTQTLTWTSGFDQSGDTLAVFSVTDGEATVLDTVAITVANTNRSPMWAQHADTITTEGDLLEFTVTATDPDADSLTYTAPELPIGALFDAATQTLTWTPEFDQSGDTVVVFSVTDGTAIVQDTVGITVTNAIRAPIWAECADTITAEGDLLEFTVSATDPDDDALTYGAPVLPAGALFDAATQSFSWTPDFDQAGDTVAVFSVSDGEITSLDTVGITVSDVVSVAQDNRPSRTVLSGAYPNPFNPVTTIRYSVTGNAHVSLVIYNSTGQHIRTLVGTNQDAGYYEVAWDGRSDAGLNVASGMYIARFISDESVQSVRLTLVR